MTLSISIVIVGSSSLVLDRWLELHYVSISKLFSVRCSSSKCLDSCGCKQFCFSNVLLKPLLPRGVFILDRPHLLYRTFRQTFISTVRWARRGHITDLRQGQHAQSRANSREKKSLQEMSTALTLCCAQLAQGNNYLAIAKTLNVNNLPIVSYCVEYIISTI